MCKCGIMSSDAGLSDREIFSLRARGESDMGYEDARGDSDSEHMDLRDCLRICRVAGLQSFSGQPLNGRFAEFMAEDTSSARYCLRFRAVDPKSAWKKLQPKNVKSVPRDMFKRFPATSVPWGSEWLGCLEHYKLLLLAEYLIRDRASMAEPGMVWDDVLRSTETIILHLSDSSARLPALCMRMDAVAKYIRNILNRVQRGCGLEPDDSIDPLLDAYFNKPLERLQKVVLDLQTSFHMELIFGSCVRPEKVIVDNVPVVENMEYPALPCEQAEHEWAENVERLIVHGDAQELSAENTGLEHISSLQEDGACCICLEHFGDSTLGRQWLPCGHVFHEYCVTQMRTRGGSDRCPICRERQEELTPLQTFLDKALVHLCRREYVECAEFASKALDVDPENPYACALLADRYLSGEGLPKDLQRARELYEVADMGGDLDATCNLGNICMEEGSIEEARKYFMKEGTSGRFSIWCVSTRCSLSATRALQAGSQIL